MSKKRGVSGKGKKEGVTKAKSPKKKAEIDHAKPDLLTDPTSVTLQNSFLITNAGPSFDNFHKAYMQNRKRITMGDSAL